MKEKNELRKKTFSGLIWTFSDLVINQGLQFIIQIVLARLLLPEEFGLIGMITIFIAVSNSIVDSGFSNALIREDEVTQEDYSTVFYFNLGTSIILYIILYFSSPSIGSFFSEPQLISVLRVLAITLIINSFGLIQKTKMTRELEFKLQMVINMISSITSGIGAIILAYLGFGIWSLVFRTIILQGVQAIMLCFFNRWWPSFVFSIKSFKKLFGFGWKLLVSGLIDTTYNNLYYVIIGKIYSSTDLGYYTNAQKLRDVASNSISLAVQKVTYPVLSNIQSEEERLRIAYRKMIRSAVYVTFPFMFGLLIIAKPLITILFGENWVNSIVYFQILCIAGMLYPLHALNLNILQVKGRSDLFLRLEIIKKGVSVSLIIIAIILKFRIDNLIWIMVLNSVICFFINSYYSKSIIGYSTFQQLKDISKIFIVTILMGIIACIPIFLNMDSNFLLLIIQVLLGIISYIIFSKILKLEEFKVILTLLIKKGE
ncbi:lipopolysaccharide biosynthesis protein [Clostridium thermobutyricum]|uniref:Teichuronic acid biosynthesis protein TuaB n=1 Tax=Clostridium thermobutyricum DSM 4928 TaxID=1121339 RepID=A0A1V4SYP4_9CLOT|nr:lipopolysaccharide biosynthesis protein [Clostridium thermobutyricum]OPX50369.1 teichuronic acid biosynthesis protein TuaB [Clostridium thermobutyricum DSM 4928]